MKHSLAPSPISLAIDAHGAAPKLPAISSRNLVERVVVASMPMVLAACATSNMASSGTNAGAAKPLTAAAPSMAAASSAPTPKPPTPGVPGGPSTPSGPTLPSGPTMPGVPPAAAGATAPSTPPAPPIQPGQPPAFAAVIKDAKKSDGLFGVWRKDERVWLELKPEDFDKPFFLSPKLTQGIGEAGIYGGRMFGRWGLVGRSQLVEFRRVYNQVRLVALNTSYVAPKGTPEGRTVAASFSPSLLTSTLVSSQPHPERKTVLIDATSMFTSDMLGLGASLQQSFRQGYSLDPRHTAVTDVRADDKQVVFNVQAHFATSSLSTPTPGAPPGVPMPSVPSALPDARSMFVGMHYSLSALPDKPMAARKADPRVGYFASTSFDYADDLTRTPKKRVVNRWRLEKKDPAAEVSDPVKPITFWIDRTIPVKYREAITKGILGWNPAFEKIGFKGAVEVKVQPDDATWDTLDVGVASVRWIHSAQPAFGAIGPSQVDPRTGEILDADISFESLSSRNLRAVRSQIFASVGKTDWSTLLQLPRLGAASNGTHDHDGTQCLHHEHATEQLGYAMDVLEARGTLDPSGPEAEKFVLEYLVDVTMHEVGHTLGLRHNFRSSKTYTDKQLSDADFTAKNGLAGSVMEYAPINLPRPGERGGTNFQTVLGPYDYWAIEYGYKPIAPEQEATELERIAGRSGEPLLAYGTDEDNILGIDPDTLHFDLGDDTVGFARKRFDIAADVIRRQEIRPLKPSDDYGVLTRSVAYALRDMGRSAGVLTRQIGGLRTLRDFANTGRDPLQPNPARVQRDALDALAKGLFAADSVTLSPTLQRRMAPDFDERSEALFAGDSAGDSSYSVVPSVMGLQRAVLNQLMSDGVAARVIDNGSKVDRDAKGADAPLQLSELYSRLTREIWSELSTGGEIAPMRRELQREHINRLSAQLLRPTSSSRADTRSQLRAQAQWLLARMQSAKARAGADAQTRAHLDDATDSLSQALGAKLQRQGV